MRKCPRSPLFFSSPHRDKHHRFDEKIHSFSLKIDHFSDVCTVVEIFSLPRVLKSVCFKMHFSRQSVCSIRESSYICSIKSQLPSAVRKLVTKISILLFHKHEKRLQISNGDRHIVLAGRRYNVGRWPLLDVRRLCRCDSARQCTGRSALFLADGPL